MTDGLKNKILKLRSEGKSYKAISEELGCSKATISYHCNRNDVGGRIDGRNPLDEETIIKLQEYYLTHTIDECTKEFGVSKTTVIKYVENKLVLLTEEEKRVKNYNKVKVHRQKIKERAVEYMGSKCSRCHYDKCIWALEFHHLNPDEKDFSVSRYQYLSWDKIQEELGKCIMVCSNCHRELHHQEYIDKLD
jgi:transposase